jgi:hypothetical protein
MFNEIFRRARPPGGLVCSGVYMAAANKEADWSSREDQLKRLVASLEENLRLLDELGSYPELGARLADVIDVLRRETID